MDHVRAQCPRPECRMYMLFPLAAMSSVMKCFACKLPMQLGVELAADGISVATGPVEVAPQLEKRRCPYCNAKMKVPTADPKQAIQCPKCNNIFTVENMQIG